MASAYEYDMVRGLSATSFNAFSNVSASEYITMALRALYYHDDNDQNYVSDDGADFKWDEAWLLSDEIGLTAVDTMAQPLLFSEATWRFWHQMRWTQS